MFRKFMVILALVVGITGISSSAASAGDLICTTGDCQTQPAQLVETQGPTVTTTTDWRSVSKETVKKWVKEETKRTKRTPVFYWKPKGLPKSEAKRCIDPVKRGYIKVGQKFKNTWQGRVIGWRPWRRGDVVCNWRIVGKGKHKRLKGTIRRCGNEDIEIYFDVAMVRHKKIKKVTEYKSKESFIKKMIQRQSSGNSTSTTTTTIKQYVCPEGWTLIGGNMCRWCPPPSCKPGPKREDHPPQVSLLKPAHLFPESSGVFAYAIASDEDGDEPTVHIEASGAASTGGTTASSVVYDGVTDTWSPCPTGKWCFKAEIFTGSQPGTATLKATVVAGGLPGVPAQLTFPVEPDKGF